MECAFMLKSMGCAQGRKNLKRKYRPTQNIQNYKLKNLQNLVLDKWNIAKVHNCVSLSCRRFFFSFHLKVNVVEDLISFGIEYHTLGPTKVREHFPEGELTLGKNRLLRLLVLWSENELSWLEWNIHQSGLEAVCCDKSAWIFLLIKYKFWEGLRCLSAGKVLLDLEISCWLVLLFLLLDFGAWSEAE